jgi:hypothetical protein
MPNSESLLFPCPNCENLFDPADVRWTCSACQHTNEHWSAWLNCEACHYSPDSTTMLPCPHCSFEIRVMGIMFLEA